METLGKTEAMLLTQLRALFDRALARAQAGTNRPPKKNRPQRGER
jgi:hypothetical protein